LYIEQGASVAKTDRGGAAKAYMVLGSATITSAPSAGANIITFVFANERDPADTVTKQVQLIQEVQYSGVAGIVHDFGCFGLEFENAFLWCSFKSRIASSRVIATAGLAFDFEAHDLFPLHEGIEFKADTCYAATKTKLEGKVVWILGNLVKSGCKAHIYVSTCTNLKL
jgi:hypothetical protein